MELEPRTSAPAHATGAVEFVALSALVDDATFRLREEGDVSALASSLGRLGQLIPVDLRPAPGGEPGRYQVIAGFRRVAALRLLRRERVLARVHRDFSDEDAWGLALGLALLTEPLDRSTLAALRDRLRETGVAPWADELVDEGIVRAPVEPELRERLFELLGSPEAAAPSDDEGLPGEAETGDEQDLAALDGAKGEGGPAEAPAGSAPAEEEGPVEVTPEELAADLATRLYDVNADLAVAYESWADLPPDGRRAILEQARWIADLLPRLEEDVEEER